MALLILAAAAASATPGAARILWIGDFHGAGDGVRTVGFLVGVAAGVATWRVARSRLTDLLGIVVTVATVSLLASLPTTIDQTSQLIQLYGGMTSTQAQHRPASQISSAQEDQRVFDRLRAAVPPGSTYVLHADFPFTIWAHYWLLPRIAVTTPRKGDWVIFHGVRPGGAARRLTGLRQIDAQTWIARASR